MPQPFPALSPAAGHPSRPGKTLTSLGQGQQDSPQPCSLPSDWLGSEQGLCGAERIHVLPCQLPARKLFPQPVPEETWLCPKGTRFQRGKPRLGCAAWQGLLHSNVIWGSYPMGGLGNSRHPQSSKQPQLPCWVPLTSWLRPAGTASAGGKGCLLLPATADPGTAQRTG